MSNIVFTDNKSSFDSHQELNGVYYTMLSGVRYTVVSGVRNNVLFVIKFMNVFLGLFFWVRFFWHVAGGK